MGEKESGDASEDQRERILRSAALVMAERGFDAARMRDVARGAGVSIGLLQHYFDTRDLLFRAAFDWSIDDLIARWRKGSSAEPDAWRRFGLLVRELADDPDLRRRCATWIEFCASAARRPELRDGVRRAHEDWRELVLGIVESGVAAGTFTPAVPADVAVRSVLAAVDGCDLAVASGSGMGAEDYAAVILATARSVLGVRE
ncbi:TetR family transcriptional regulator [Streptomyces antnestii]|uniref:TetR family transcriptional regulator n=1 Tax=Streptomyces antnestii TaxID=2494256 RepID=A0A437Q308_9ACTN|nr:TetR family transcriptional regulator C-terminal domain-containing protein [Streptomyces sp. San01]RVU28845.1 TetR family transcriptional regulator [Streptomyces sp. San01]